MNLTKENKELKEKIKAYESYYGNRLVSLCLLCDLPMNSQNKVSVNRIKNYQSRLVGHYHPKCWRKIKGG